MIDTKVCALWISGSSESGEPSIQLAGFGNGVVSGKEVTTTMWVKIILTLTMSSVVRATEHIIDLDVLPACPMNAHQVQVGFCWLQRASSREAVVGLVPIIPPNRLPVCMYMYI